MIKSSIKYRECGISTIATDANKRSVMQWKRYQEQIGTDDELQSMFDHPKAQGLAIVCGGVSGGLEVIDVDCKYDLTGTLFDDLMQRIVDDLPEIAGKLVIASTVSGGYHIMYRCDVIEGNLKLASRQTTEAERTLHPHQMVKVLVETRGEGGYVVAAPTEGYKYTSGKPQGIVRITPQQREALIAICRSFNQVHEQVSHKTQYVEQRPFNKSPFEDYNERGDIIALLQRHGWKVVEQRGEKIVMLRPGDTKSSSSGDYHTGKGLFSVFTTSTQFEPQKGYKPCAVYCMLECGGDWKVAAKKLLAEGYGEPLKRVPRDVKTFIRRAKEDGIEGERLRQAVEDKFGLAPDASAGAISSVEREDEAAETEFWEVGARGSLKVVLSKFGEFLGCAGFGKYRYNKKSLSSQLVYNNNNRLEEADSETIRKFTLAYIQDLDLSGVEYSRRDLLEMIFSDKMMFSDGLFQFLPYIDIDFLKDTPDTCYYPFRNGVVEIKAGGATLRNYGEIDKVIWKSDIIDFDIDLDYLNGTEPDNGCEFIDFVTKALGGEPDRILSACTLIGYILHKYKHPARAHAVVLGEETDDESKGGGTGKGIFVKAIEAMMPTVTIDGKTFKPDKSFVWQRVNLETKLIVIQDTTKQFPFQGLYSVITEGLTAERKNKDELYLLYPDSPKILITTNYTVNDEGNHAKRRLKLIEFSNYFSPGRTPEDEYGHLLFNDWDADEWNRFYNFMFWCIQVYLDKGVVDLPQGEKYKTKKIKTQYGDEFAEWFVEYAANGCATEKPMQEVYSGFLKQYDFDKKDYSQKRFGYAIRTAAENFGFDLRVRKNRQGGGERLVRMVKPGDVPDNGEGCTGFVPDNVPDNSLQLFGNQ